MRFAPTVAAVAAASMMLPFSVTGGAIALPTMATDLDSSVGTAQWVLNAFNVTFAALPLTAGSLADRYGRRRVLLTGTTLVGLMAVLIATAPSMAVVVAARAVQGAGAAAVLASGAAVLANATEGKQRQLAFGILGTSFGTGLAIGPLAAGALIDLAGWRSVFYLIAGMSLAAGLCATQAPESWNPNPPPLDIAGFTTFTAGLAFLSLGFVQVSTGGWTAPAFVVAAVLVAVFIAVELRRKDQAMFDVRLFRRPEFVAVVCQPFTVTLGFVVLLVYVPAYLHGNGHSTIASGLLILPMTAPVLLLPLVASRWPLRTVLTSASVLIAMGALLLTTLEHTIALPLIPFGVGVGLAFGVMDNAAVSTVPVENAGAAAGIFNTMRIAGESVAVAGAAALLTTLTAGPDGDVELAGRVVQGMPSATMATSFTNAFHVLGIVLAVLSAVGAVLTYRALRPSTAALRS